MSDRINNWAAMALVTGPLAIFSERRYRSLPAIPEERPLGPLPSLSIVIPARNEEANLPCLLRSLNAICYPGSLELIVVDDNSSDDTARVAERLGARVVRLNHLPCGWLGKPHACHQGVQVASGEWLLFTDADTIHDPGGPARAVAYAERNQLDGLSAFVRQNPSGIVDRLGLTAAHAGLFLTLRAERGLLNGQYILLRRVVYNACGGFSAVRRERLEDVALGRRLRAGGYDVPVHRGDDVAAVRMYTDKTDLWHGLSRIGSGTLSWLGPGAAVTALFITGAMAPVLALSSALGQRRKRRLAALSWLAVAAGFVPWARRFGSPWLAFFVPIGSLLVQVAGAWGLLSNLTGRGLQWKERKI